MLKGTYQIYTIIFIPYTPTAIPRTGPPWLPLELVAPFPPARPQSCYTPHREKKDKERETEKAIISIIAVRSWKGERGGEWASPKDNKKHLICYSCWKKLHNTPFEYVLEYTVCINWKGAWHKIFDFRFFHESVTSGPVSIQFAEIFKSKGWSPCVNDTGDKPGVVVTGDKLIAGVM